MVVFVPSNNQKCPVMKKIILSMMMLMSITAAQAQEYEYVPLVREGAAR